MYAIVQTGGKQYKVQAGDQIKVEKLGAEPGDQINLDQVLAVADADSITVGSPVIEDALVKATIVRTARDRKIIVFKKKRRHGFKKKQGHRQWYTLLRIDSVEAAAASATTEPTPAVAE
jgi:large subunit ribosomal protein L21